MLCPQAQRTAKSASPIVPFSGHRDRRPSVFMWPIPASITLRRRRSAIGLGVKTLWFVAALGAGKMPEDLAISWT